jgi:hypothetical protein
MGFNFGSKDIVNQNEVWAAIKSWPQLHAEDVTGFAPLRRITAVSAARTFVIFQ